MTERSQAILQEYCQAYFDRLSGKKGVSSSAINQGMKKAVKSSNTSEARKYKFIGKNLWSPGVDIEADESLDLSVIQAFEAIPDPTLKVEKHFLMMRSGNEDALKYSASEIFEMPENGGSVAYECWLNRWINWLDVAATCHTHPLYRERRVDNENKHFSNGDPTGLIIKGVPVYMRTPKTKQIKVLELKDGFVTTRVVYGSSAGDLKKWKKRSF